MLLLALDTSTRYSSIALCSEDAVYGEYTWYSGNNHSVELLEHLQRLSAECQVSFSHLDAIAVATGPGSFNGVRVALATAKALAFSLQKPLIGVNTLDIVALQQAHWQGLRCAVLEAGRGELYAACFLFEEQQGSDGELFPAYQQMGEYLLMTPEQLAAHIQEQMRNWLDDGRALEQTRILFCGEMSAMARQVLRTHLPTQSYFTGNLQGTRRATALAQLGWQRFHAGSIDDPLTLEPCYLRRPSITTSTRKQPLLGGPSQRPTGLHTTEREEGALRH